MEKTPFVGAKKLSHKGYDKDVITVFPKESRYLSNLFALSKISKLQKDSVGSAWKFKMQRSQILYWKVFKY